MLIFVNCTAVSDFLSLDLLGNGMDLQNTFVEHYYLVAYL